ATDVANAASAEGALRHLRINFIGVNPEENKIVVCTSLKATDKIKEILPKEAGKEYEIEYIKGNAPLVRLPRKGNTFDNPFYLHKGIYSCGSSVFTGNQLGAGTLGCIVKDKAGNFYGLSNNH